MSITAGAHVKPNADRLVVLGKRIQDVFDVPLEVAPVRRHGYELRGRHVSASRERM